MIYITSILGFFLFLIITILITPFYIKINSINNKYGINFPFFFGIKMIKTQNKWQVKSRFLFIRFNLKRFINPRQKKIEKKMKEKKRISNFSEYFFQIIHTGINMIHSFSIKKFWAEIDTGDFAVNAQLYPVISALGLHENILINYENRNSLDLIISGQLYKLIFHIIKFYLKTKKLIIKN